MYKIQAKEKVGNQKKNNSDDSVEVAGVCTFRCCLFVVCAQKQCSKAEKKKKKKQEKEKADRLTDHWM